MTDPNVQVKVASRETFQSEGALQAFVQGCQAIVHLAGMNRGDDSELYDTNILLTQKLIQSLVSESISPHVIFSSSTHRERDTAYGRSKRDCATLLKGWASGSGALFTELILPHVFGEGGKPFYNSVISTLCYQVAHHEMPTLNAQGVIEPVHAQEVARQIIDIISTRSDGEVRVHGRSTLVQDVYERIAGMAREYSAQILPDLRDPFDLALFNTYRSYLFPEAFPVGLHRHSDDRGSLVETVKSHQGGQTFISTTRPGITRGNHFHLRKVERFLVLAGEAVIRLRRVGSDAVVSFHVNGDQPCYIDMPTMHTHSINNLGTSPLMTLFWSSEIFNAADADTHSEPVILDA
jgi:UDP-2-acetamido-2,6-beta-L-arabino-hexul-4-ose reductase